MKYLLVGVLICAFLDLKAQDPSFKVSIEQSRKTLSPVGDKVTLQKAPFNIIFEFNQAMGLLIGAYFTTEDYEMAKKGVKKEEIPSFAGGGMAEGMFNDRKILTLAPDAVNYWYYQTDDDHRFDEVINNEDGSFTCIRRIENIEDIYGDYTTVRENSKPIYLVFISFKNDADYNEIELQRETLELSFK